MGKCLFGVTVASNSSTGVGRGLIHKARGQSSSDFDSWEDGTLEGLMLTPPGAQPMR